MNVAGILTCLSILFCAVDVQAQNHSPEQLPDTVPVLMGDSTILQVSDSTSVVMQNGKGRTGKQDRHHKNRHTYRNDFR